MSRIGQRTILNPGLLRHQVQVQQKSVTAQDSYGQDTYTWATVVTLWADIRALQGREMEAVQQRWADARWKVITQFNASVRPAMRVLWWDGSRSRSLDIVDVQDPFACQDRLVMYCREVA